MLGFFGARDPLLIALWISIIFVSILVHELGHALTARAYGAEVAIELNGIGGLTRWSIPSSRLGPGRRALVAAAGSAVGVLFGGLVWLVALQFGPYRGITSFVINNLIFVNVFWGLLNWLPIRPLDGGHLLLSLLERFAPERGDVIARVVFVLTAAGGLIFGITSDRLFIALIAGWLLFSEIGTRDSSDEIPAGPVPQFGYDDDPDLSVEQEESAAEMVVEEPDDDRGVADG